VIELKGGMTALQPATKFKQKSSCRWRCGCHGY